MSAPLPRALHQGLWAVILNVALVSAGAASAEGQQVQHLGPFTSNSSPLSDVGARATWQAAAPLVQRVITDGKGDGTRRALLGAAIGGIGLAVVGSQLCERNEPCTGTVIGFALIGATLGAVVGAFTGGATEEVP